MKEINIVSLQMIKTDTLSYLKDCITSPEDVAETMQSFIVNYDLEHRILICMNSKNEPTHSNNDSSREIFKTTILSNVNSIIPVHNNSSSNVTPSPKDINVIELIMFIIEMMGILFYDCIIYSDCKTYSIRRYNLKLEV